MKLKIREKLEVLVDHYPNYTSLNTKLMEDVNRADYSLSYKTNIYGKHSNWNTKTDNIKFTDIDTYNDHRIAMCFSMVAVGGHEVIINDPKCTAKTFPTFFSVLDSISHFDYLHTNFVNI